MAGPSDMEQLLLQYINEARIDPLGDAARFIASYVPAHSNDPNVQNALSFFGVDGSQLLSALSSLTPTQPVAWNDSLGNAARQHSQLMITDDSQEHQLPSEASFDQRDAAAGYSNESFGGENIFASATSPLEAQAAFMIDWGPGPGGMQSPAGHRTNIMSPSFREIGVGIVQDSSPTANAGPVSVTEDFGTRFNSGAFILGVAYNDTDHNNFYSIGEGLGNLVVSLGNTSVTSWASGGYTLNTSATGTQTVNFSGAGLAGTVSATVSLTSTTNDIFDVVNGNTIETSNSASVSGAFAALEGLGATGLQLAVTDASPHNIIGTKAGDTLTGGSGNDTITGGGNNDVINGGGGTNWAVFSGTKASYGVTQSGATTTVSGPDGTDTLTNIAFLQFADGTTNLAGGSVSVITLGGAAQTVVGAAGNTIVGGSGSAVINATAGPETITGGSGAMTVFGGVGDSIVAGSGPAYIDGSNGGMSIMAGSAGGNDTFVGSVSPAAPDTFTGGAAFVLIQGLGAGDIVNFAGQSGTAFINATAGNNAVTLGSGFAAVYGGNGDTIMMGTASQLATGFSGGTKIIVGAAGTTDSVVGSVARVSGTGPDTIIGGGANVVVQGLGSGDIVSFGAETGTAAINAVVGNDAITLGSGAASVFGGNGDTVTFGSGNQYADGLLGGVNFIVGSAGGSDTIVGSAFRAPGAPVDTLTGGAAAVLIEGLAPDDVVNFANQTGSAAINATAGNNAVTLGNGAASVFGGVGGSIVLGSGAQLAAALSGGETIAVGSAGGNDTIVGSVFRTSGVGVDTLTGGAAAVNVAGLGNGDIVNFANQTGTAVINALGGNNAITLGGGAATVFAGAGDTVTLGTGPQYVDASFAPGALIKLGSTGSENVAGSMLAGGGVTIKGGGASLTYNAGVGGDLIDLTGTSGSAVINGLGADTGAINDTIIAGNGGTTVFGGNGDRIGTGINASGTDQFFHSTTIAGASVGFGANGTTANSSSAQVTVTGFAETGGNATDFLFYQGENPGTNMSIVTGSTQTTVSGAASTMLTLPDGTVMTLVGVAKADFNPGFFK